jgi:hypothetical protein
LHEQRLAARLNQLPKQEVEKAPNGINVIVPKRTAHLKLIEAHTDNVMVIPREGETQAQLDKRSQHFVDIYVHGGVIPPPMLHTLPDGRIEVIDGRARANAYRILGVKAYPANENDELSDIATSANESGIFESGNKLIAEVGGAAQKVGGFAGHQVSKVIGSEFGRKRGSLKLRALSKQEKATLHMKNAVEEEKKYPFIKPIHTRTRLAKWRTAGYRHKRKQLEEETAAAEKATQTSLEKANERIRLANWRIRSAHERTRIAKEKIAKAKGEPSLEDAKSYAAKAKAKAEASKK